MPYRRYREYNGTPGAVFQVTIALIMAAIAISILYFASILRRQQQPAEVLPTAYYQELGKVKRLRSSSGALSFTD